MSCKVTPIQNEKMREQELDLMAMVTEREEQLDEAREVWQETSCENEKLKEEIVRLSETARGSDRNTELRIQTENENLMIPEMDKIRVKVCTLPFFGARKC